MYYCFCLKKLILSVMIAILAALCISAAVPAVKTAAEKNGTKVPVIMYHGLTESADQQNQYMISPELFESDLKYLADNGYTTITVSELVRSVEKNEPLPEKPVLLTFDDGYLNNYEYAFPLLKGYNAKAVISPIARAADEAENEKYRSVRWSQCTWAQLREMQQSGLVEIENHSYDLHITESDHQGAQKKPSESQKEYEQRLSEDIMKAHRLIEEKTGYAPVAFVYPFGAKSEGSTELLLSLGYHAALDCEEKMNYISAKSELMHIHRFLRPDNTNSADFFGRVLR